MKADGFIRILRIIFLIFIVVFFCPFAYGKVIYVDNDGQADFNNIQAGIDEANDGDSILIGPGEYIINQPITFRGKAITVISEAGPNETTIRMGTPVDTNRRSVVVFENKETAMSVLEGFTLMGGKGFFVSSANAWVGGGIFFHASSGTVRNCAMIQNTARDAGGGIMVYYGSHAILTNCNINENSVMTQGGGGVACIHESSVTINKCVITKNSSSTGGGGVLAWDKASIILTNCNITENSTGDAGGGVWCGQNSSAIVTDCTIAKNMAQKKGGGGLICYDRSLATITNCMIAENSTPWGGGVMSENNSFITVTNCTFIGNTVGWGGGGLVCWLNSSLNIYNCTIFGNSAGKSGGGVECFDGCSVLVTNSIISGNMSPKGHEISVRLAASTLTIYYSNVDGGQAEVNIERGCTLNWGVGIIDADPHFVDPNNNDHHLKSQTGRWDPTSESWVQDDVTSPCIDVGDPNSPIGHEPFPNGGIINMGAYGGTAEASKSPSGLHAKYGGGTGETNNPYLIYTAEHMNTIGLHEEDWDKHFMLMADIDLSAYSGTDFNIIGYWVGLDSPENRPFRGVFDGNGHTISNFTYSCTGKNHIGLFGYIEDPDAAIKNLGLIDPNIDAGIEGWGAGSLAGYLREGIITNCYVEGGSVSGNEDVGGLVGNHWFGTITNCYSKVSVSGNENVGGLAGLNMGIINTCYSAGHVEGNVEVGGLVGFGAGVIASYWDIETSGQLTSFGGKGRKTAEMQTASTFLGWSIGSVWKIDEGKDYPRLWWEEGLGEEPEPLRLFDFLTGSGTENDPYLIYTAEQLNIIGIFPNDWDKYFKLMADIDLAGLMGTDYNFIGMGTDNAFTGVFDGNGRKISNLTYTSTKVLFAGLFAYVNGASAEIKDLGLIEPKVHTGTAGWSWGVGALVGWLEVGTITNCYVERGSVSGNQDVGGLVGSNQDLITNCYAIAVVDCNSGGGLVGNNWLGEITNCYSAGSISGNEWVGGLAGFNLGTITNCYSAGSVTANDMVGGLVGENYGDITGSFWDTQTSGQPTSDGGTGKTTAQMQTLSTFTNAGWDFVGETVNGTEDIWRIYEGQDYPRLWWELIE